MYDDINFDIKVVVNLRITWGRVFFGQNSSEGVNAGTFILRVLGSIDNSRTELFWDVQLTLVGLMLQSRAQKILSMGNCRSSMTS